MTGNPVHLYALAEREVGNLTLIANNVGEPGLGGAAAAQRPLQSDRSFSSNPEAVAAAQSGAE
jgi:acyl CoA:acetate/3-ketoacid CoA transferase alpha subunit